VEDFFVAIFFKVILYMVYNFIVLVRRRT